MDSPLTANGEAQARALGRALAMAKINCRMIISSNQSRSIRTAAIVHSVLQEASSSDGSEIYRVQAAAFQELHCGELEGAPLITIRDELTRVSKAWNEGLLGVPVAEGGESPADVVGRVKEGLNEVLDLGGGAGDVVIIAHSNLIKILIAHADRDVQRKIFSVKQGNACINVVDIGASGVEKIRVVRTNITEHLANEARLLLQ